MMIFKHSNRKALAFWAPDSGLRHSRCWLGMVSSRCLILRLKLMELEGERIQHHGLRKMFCFLGSVFEVPADLGEVSKKAFGSCPSHFETHRKPVHHFDEIPGLVSDGKPHGYNNSDNRCRYSTLDGWNDTP